MEAGGTVLSTCCQEVRGAGRGEEEEEDEPACATWDLGSRDFATSSPPSSLTTLLTTHSAYLTTYSSISSLTHRPATVSDSPVRLEHAARTLSSLFHSSIPSTPPFSTRSSAPPDSLATSSTPLAVSPTPALPR